MKAVSTIKIILNEEEVNCFRNSAEIFNKIFEVMRDNDLKEVPILIDEDDAVTWENTFSFDFLEDATNVLECF